MSHKTIAIKAIPMFRFVGKMDESSNIFKILVFF